MPYHIRSAPAAAEDFYTIRAFDQARLRDAIASQLCHEPTVPTRHRKKLQSNPIATWELRVGDWRVLYDVEEDMGEVKIMAIGRKVHNKLIIREQEYEL
jgi:mRNA-degrading endonuclease RelE of RelBE toxin-antitoxin system